MDASELKQRIGILSVAFMYGCRPNRSGFCHCPFPDHRGDRTASLKLYPEQGSFHCYGCGANGDIFDFVRKMEGCDFKTAFLFLGGSYQDAAKPSVRLRRYRMGNRRDRERKTLEQLDAKLMEVSEKLCIYRWLRDVVFAPMTDGWAHAVKKYEYWLYVHETLFEEFCNKKEGDRS